MKPLVTIVISLITSGSIFGQCPPAGLKFQSVVCHEPTNLRVKALTCNAFEVRWKGRQDQVYEVTASSTNPATRLVRESKVSQYYCDGAGNCSATLPANEPTKVNWSVQAICSNGGSTSYSNTMEGEEVAIPNCSEVPREVTSETAGKFRVYPNPSTGYVTVQFNSVISGNTDFNVFDMIGKLVYQETGSLKSKTNMYQLDLRSLVSGSYVLRVNNARGSNGVKFVLFTE